MDYIFSIPQQHFYTVVIVLFLLVIATSITIAGNTEILKNHKTGKAIRYGGNLSDAPIKIPKHFKAGRLKMRGVWVATIASIDFGKHKKKTSFQKEYREVVHNLAKNNFNTIIFQVRPANDAFYKSELNPWSRYLSGKEGEGISGFDPLKFMVEEAHRHGLEFHAWLNPYRVAGKSSFCKQHYLEKLSPKNFARKNPGFVLEIPLGSGDYQLILDPGEPEVIEFIEDTVKEIVTNYDVDAIHFDDYFYPYRDIGDIDKNSFAKYNTEKLSLEDWRRKNVNTVIKGVHTYLKSLDKNVQFGISPFGIWANKKSNPEGSLSKGLQSYYYQFADSRRWVKEGWIDYIVPQLYWSFNNDLAPYAALTDWWVDVTKKTKVNLYIGQSVSRLGFKGGWKNSNEIFDQLRYNSKYKTIKGTVFFSYTSVFRPKNKCMKKGIKKALKALQK
jgi:uncharacterized lipoprotein YddW (UPF0748 family)